jgi:hypothetical protein
VTPLSCIRTADVKPDGDAHAHEHLIDGKVEQVSRCAVSSSLGQEPLMGSEKNVAMIAMWARLHDRRK